MIGILNARSGNIGSLENALNYLKIDYSIIEKSVIKYLINYC